MRHDLFQVIIDRPRTGGDGGKSKPPKGSKRRRQKEELENASKFESNAPHRIYGWDAKRLNEHLGPLIRFLRSNVGRPWDKVFSEICQHISQNSATQSHVRDHVLMEVHTDTILVGRKVLRSSSEKMYRRFFVHPISGLLCENKYSAYRKYKHKKPKNIHFVPGRDADHVYKIINGVWYEITLATIPKEHHVVYYDIIFSPRRKGIEFFFGPSSLSYWERKKEYGDANKYAAAKRQVGKRELKQLKLWDTTAGIHYRNHLEKA